MTIEIEADSAHTSSSASLQGTTLASMSNARVSEIFWPKDLLPVEIPNCRILSWGYDMDVDHATSSA